MNKNYIVVLHGNLAGIPLIVGLRISYNEHPSDLATSMDILAVEVVPNDSGDQVIDTETVR